MMQLLVLILKKVELIDLLIKELVESGIKGGTILEGTGMAKELVSMEDLPIFGMLRSILTDDVKKPCKIMLFVLKDEQVKTARETIRDVVGDLNAPNSGILFSIPLNFVEGFGEYEE